jgi:two-component system LytT family response regulator
MIKSVAIDDEPKALEIIKNHISKIDYLSMEATFTNPFEAISYINDNKIELVFLDINMPDISGLKLKTHLKFDPLIIFTTAHSEYALDSYEIEAIDYLLKPFDFSRFLSAVNKAKERLKIALPISEFFFLSSGNQKRKLFYNDILYIQADGNYVTYYTKSEKVIVRSSIKDTMNDLPVRLFFQIHRSTIISLKWIDKVEDNHVYIGSERLPVSSTHKDQFMKFLSK